MFDRASCQLLLFGDLLKVIHQSQLIRVPVQLSILVSVGATIARESAPRFRITVAAMRSLSLGWRVFLQKDIENWVDISQRRAHHCGPPQRASCDVV